MYLTFYIPYYAQEKRSVWTRSFFFFIFFITIFESIV